MTYIYDIESYVNYFSVIFKNVKSKKLTEFVIFDTINQIDDLYYFITDNSKWLIGYNSFNYDNQILNFIYKKHSQLTFQTAENITNILFKLTKLIIEQDFTDFKYNLPFKSIDLMKIGGYKKSLKLLGVSLKWHKLQDLPLPVNSTIHREDVNTIRLYNLNDVNITEQLYYHLLDAIKFRHEISKIYNVNVYNEADTGIANRLLEKFYSEATGLPVRDFKYLRTPRKFIKFDWVVFDDIRFHTNTMDTMLEEIKNHVYYEGKPFFSKKVTFDGTTYKLGIGGIHSVDKGNVFEETETDYVIDADIGSMYPTTVINNQLSPEHLGKQFLKQFKSMRDTRLKEKSAGNMTKAEGLKLILNAAIGKTRSKYSFLYDPLVNLQVTVNGQLYILMLIEQLVLHGFKVISANTDGITAIIPKNRVDEYYKVCEKWEQNTDYTLEYAYYTTYARRDVNNYIAIKNTGEVKTKGIFIHEPAKRFNNSTDPLNKGWDKPITSIALYKYFVEGIPIEDTIINHRDIYDFCIAKKIDNKFTNEFHYLTKGILKVDTLQKSVRYYVSTKGGSLFKTNRKDNQVENYEANKTVSVFNNHVYYNNFNNYNIDYSYYIHNTRKIINEIINQQLSLF